MEKILITGSNGLLGRKLIKLFSKELKVFPTSLHQPPEPHRSEKSNFFKMDVTDKERVFEIVEKVQPDVVLHTAALTDVDYCEEHRRIAWRVNVLGARNVAQACKLIGARLIHLSSDYVFDGQDGPYSEVDRPHPANYYGRTKLKSEDIVQKLGLDYAICRTCVLYGWSSHVRSNFLTWVIKMLKEDREIRVVTDQFGTPTLADDLAKMILSVCQSGATGIYHTSGGELIDRFSFALKIAKKFGLPSDLIKPTTSQALSQPAPRPLRGGLKTEKIQRELNIKPLTINQGLEIVRGQMAG